MPVVLLAFADLARTNVQIPPFLGAPFPNPSLILWLAVDLSGIHAAVSLFAGPPEDSDAGGVRGDFSVFGFFALPGFQLHINPRFVTGR